MEKIFFNDYPEFQPNLTPSDIFKLGSFGGTYWRPIYSSITKKEYENEHKEFPSKWWEDLSEDYLSSSKCNVKLNKYKVKSGTSLKFWEKKEWIVKQDPYGWVQWYCRFFKGRRSPDDDRQIRRWKAFAGEKGRFRNQLINLVISRETSHDDESVSPVIRQSLQHWAYRLNFEDFEKAALDKWKSEIC